MTTLTLACTGHSAWQDNADQAQRITISLVNALKRHTKAAAPVLALIVIEIALRCGFVLEGFDEAQYDRAPRRGVGAVFLSSAGYTVSSPLLAF